jgi:hypothetical protein
MPDSVITGTLSTLDQSLIVGCDDSPLVAIDVSGAWTGALIIEANLDPSHALWRLAPVFTLAGLLAATPLAGNGRWLVATGVVGQVRARFNPATSGGAVVTLRAGDNESFGAGGGGGAGPGGPLTDHSGTIAVGCTPQGLLAANLARAYFFLQNQGPADLWFNYTTAAAVGQPSVRLAPGATYESSPRPSPEALSVISATTGNSFTCKES